MAMIGIPSDIRWQRICYTEDMADPAPCDDALPPKWQTSIAVFRYVPEDEYQVTEGRRLSYLKVTCTISSYQPNTDEVGIVLQGSALSVGEELELERKLKSYKPCNGAIVQVTVTPHEQTPLRDYPYIADVQPKQRALYEQVTDTGEVSSRSLETLNVRKGAGTTESQEVLDVDKGVSTSGNVEANAQYAGVGGGVGVGLGGSQSFERGAKSLGQADRSRIETTDSTRESREVLSHTTQLTQMYTLLQTYHVGTNRVMFYLSPRPHMIEEPSGFIRGPRLIDGVQDFFLIVDQLDTQQLPCVSVRLDTAHLTKIDEMDHDYSKPPRVLRVNVEAWPPLETDPNRVAVPSDPLYDCVQTPPLTDTDSEPAPAGYVVHKTTNIGVEEVYRGFTILDAPEGSRTATLTATATGGVCYRNSFGDGANLNAITAIGSTAGGPVGTIIGLIAGATGTDVYPEERSRDPGYARRSVEVRWKSETKTEKVGERNALLVTSRLLCCCEPLKNMTVKLIDLALLPVTKAVPELTPETPPGPPDPGPFAFSTTVLSVREANELQENITEALARSASAISNVRARPALDADYALLRVREFALAVPRLRRALTQPIDDLPDIDATAMRKLRDAALPFSPPGEPPSRLAVTTTSPVALAQVLGTELRTAIQMQMHALGLGIALPSAPNPPEIASAPAKKRQTASEDTQRGSRKRRK